MNRIAYSLLLCFAVACPLIGASLPARGRLKLILMSFVLPGESDWGLWGPVPVLGFLTSVMGRGGFPGGSAGKESACYVVHLGSIPGLGRSPGEGDGYPFQYSGLENSMDRGAWWAIGGCNKSDTTEWLTLSSIKKEGNSAIWNNMNGPWGHYAKGNKSDRKR